MPTSAACSRSISAFASIRCWHTLESSRRASASKARRLVKLGSARFPRISHPLSGLDMLSPSEFRPKLRRSIGTILKASDSNRDVVIWSLIVGGNSGTSRGIGTTDDLQDADGVAVLDYGQAQRAARAWWRAELRREEGHDMRTGPYTVADAIADYLKEFEGRGGKSLYETRRAAETHVLPPLGAALVEKLTAKRIEDWHRGLAAKPALARSKPGRKPNHRKADKTADGLRKRRATANRILTVLKAALNHTWKSGHVTSDDAWRRVKPFRGVETARVRYLSDAECVRLVNGCEPAFRNLVRAALLTGCRYSELASLCAQISTLMLAF
jgi:hypothetical protein